MRHFARCMFLLLAALAAAAQERAPRAENPLIGTWTLDREATTRYLRENRVMPDDVIKKLFAGAQSVSWRFDEQRVYGVGRDNPTSMPYTIVARTGNKLSLCLRDEDTNSKILSIIVLDPDGRGYWQDTPRVRGYKERVIRVR